MKNKFLVIIVVLTSIVTAHDIPDLPIPIGAGTAEVWNNSIYFLGGANRWWGTTLYPRIYKYDGSQWSYHDSIPDNSVWDVESVLIGDEIFLLNGWPSGIGLLRKYNLADSTWTYLTSSPNLVTYGNTIEHFNGFIYLFNPLSHVFEYDIGGDTWQSKTPNPKQGYAGLSSVVYQDEIYVAGYSDSSFFKYTPSTDSWTKLANTPLLVAGGAMEVVDDKIYYAGGSGLSSLFKSVLVYDPLSDIWWIDNFQISSERHWMASILYHDSMYVLGGFDTVNQAVNTVEKIIIQKPTGLEDIVTVSIPVNFILYQNYPNPFNPSTKISWQSSVSSWQTLKIFDVLGNEVAKLVDEYKPAGAYEVEFNANNLPGGVYFYKLNAGNLTETKKLILLK